MKKCLLPILFGIIIFSTPGQTDYISVATVKTWAHKLGFELSQLGKYVTNIEKFEQSYKQAEIKPRDGNALVHEIAKDIKAMTDAKMSAIKRIMDVAETTAESASDDDSAADFNYTNAKNNTIDLQYSVHFGGEINLNLSAVHVPTNVYDRAPDVIKAIKWSQTLDETFINNLQNDPSLSWQYFGSSTGFMRQYPATVWNPKPVDLFDCRTRGWYIEAATSPKDVLILVDTSGSMMGMKREIARHVVNNILDTLGNNDFVNIITFSNVTHEVVSCFNDTLVQANLANIRELKDAIEDMQTERIANFSLVLTYAFELLEQFRIEKDGANCNQAIMLVTDGVPYNFKEIFQEYNWRNSPDEPDKADMPVRVFTYLIGREVTDVREVKWMACANRGYYVHLSTFAEVREQVLNYVPVMARPLVLGKTFHPPIWTPVYADITDPKMTDWLWERRECKEQKERFLEYHKDKKLFFSSLDQRDRYLVHKPNRKHHDFNDDVQAYQLMTSVSMPVYDRRENANITEKVLVKEAYWVPETKETRIADLLGVAGTDVPIQQIQKLMLPHMLGVNGYAFIVTNNGYILIHPDLRPVFQGILKPSYNAVDMAEVELMDNDRDSRDFDEGITMFRNEVINQANGSVILHTKYHYDDMKRVGRMKRRYDYTAIEQTPFTLVVSLPEHDHGSYRVHATEEIHRAHVNGKNATDYFSGKTWRIHPDWTYCKYHYEDDHKFESPEKMLLHFLERTRQPGWFWSDKKLPSQPPEYSVTNPGNSGSHTSSHAADRESFYCDRLLLQSLVHDAKVTAWFANINTTRDEKGKEFQQRFKLTMAFMASHSGLMRWQDYPLDDNDDLIADPDEHFSQMYRRGIDEIWYKRAVEQFYIHPDSFVFSIPIDEDNGADNTTLVTASRAIFIQNNKAKAPAAVVGFQFKHKALQELFRDITYNCDKIQNCHQSCSNTSLECYLIDNNGYVVAAENESDAGKFFGNIRGGVMTSLIQDGIYDKIKIFDYQAVCFINTQTSSHGSLISTPWKTTQRILTWFFGHVLLMWTKIGFIHSNNAYAYENENIGGTGGTGGTGGNDEDVGGVEGEGHDDYLDGDEKITSDGIIKGESSFDPRVLINRTKPQPCDKEVYLYLLKNGSTKYDIDFNSSKGCERPYVVQPVDFSNMLLVVVDVNCPNTDRPPIDTEPVEIYYNSTLACQKAFNGLKRKRPQYCVRTHKNESEIKDRCGDASSIGPNTILLTLTFIIFLKTFQLVVIH
ncbi:voltage-dependent calcium channel subunit alpha-2/delta-4 isoform X2 [Aphidius gifuensis]|uniref:voltage-dependent calcium channel subunit alpha-2/delta-4 isoform X2 n=1 Tax=Aphidius gifuensis TaxID=684658 RepID=UPI001CDD6D1E|nr:voltage-dependent calcium channel subunit alpha-2/delta-4 isoform X2 [Aphidius gifuensis]